MTAYTCADVPALTIQLAEAQADLADAVGNRDRRKAEMEAKGKVWLGSREQISLDARVAEEQAKVDAAAANLAAAQATC